VIGEVEQHNECSRKLPASNDCTNKANLQSAYRVVSLVVVKFSQSEVDLGGQRTLLLESLRITSSQLVHH